ncbi:hypothetical protein [Pseudaestuariivita rosea]|nr:hypothetical protein [Pseudaestuariivita rosea]
MKDTALTAEKVKTWLKSPVTLTVPGWAVATAGATAILLILIALD